MSDANVSVELIVEPRDAPIVADSIAIDLVLSSGKRSPHRQRRFSGRMFMMSLQNLLSFLHT